MQAEIYTGLYDNPRRAFLKTIHKDQNQKALELIETICIYLKVDKDDLMSKLRKREVALARQTCMYFLQKETTLTLKQIGRIFNRDHSTVIYGVQVVKDIRDTDPKFRLLIKDLEAYIKEK